MVWRQDRDGSRVHSLFDRRSRSPAIPPRPRHGYPAALHRGHPARPEHAARSVPHRPNNQQGHTASSPYPPDSSWRALRRRKRRFLAYSSPSRSPNPHHLAVLARPGFVGAASALPGTSRVRLPQLQPLCCDSAAVVVFHLMGVERPVTSGWTPISHLVGKSSVEAGGAGWSWVVHQPGVAPDALGVLA